MASSSSSSHFSHPDSSSRFTSRASEFVVFKESHKRLIKTAKILYAIAESTPDDMGTLRKMLRAELKAAGELFESTWRLATEIFHEKRAEGYEGLNQDEFPDEYHIALIFYVLKYCYKQFNKATWSMKNVSDVKKYPYKVLYKLIYLAIQEMPGVPSTFPPDNRLYRGVGGEPNFEEGQLVAFQHFVSTSSDIDVAIGYTSGESKRTLFVFNGYIRNSTGLLHHPPVPRHRSNKEYLLWPEEFYEVIEVRRVKCNTDGKPLKLIILQAQ